MFSFWPEQQLSRNKVAKDPIVEFFWGIQSLKQLAGSTDLVLKIHIVVFDVVNIYILSP